MPPIDPEVYARLVAGADAALDGIERDRQEAHDRLRDLEAEHRQRAEQAAERRAAAVRDAAFRARIRRTGHPFRHDPEDHEGRAGHS